MKQKRQRREKWTVYGEYGGNFTNLKEAKEAAKEASKTEEYNFCCEVWLIENGCYYFQYENGKCTYNGWDKK